VEFSWALVGTDRITQIWDNLGRTVSYTYDAGGRLSQVTDPAGGTTTYTYDGATQRIKTIGRARRWPCRSGGRW
jgi:YD repeat-containing protein